MKTHSNLLRPLRYIPLLIGISFIAACANSSSETARFCDVSGCSERPLSSATADYLENTQIGKTEQIKQLEKLAEHTPEAAYDLALRYFRGEGVARDSYQGLQWMRKAGDGGLLEAQKALGGYYLSGFEEMGNDPQEAQKWFSMAAGQGDAESVELINQASVLKANEAEAYRWRKHWQQHYRSYWYRGYPYLGRWSHTHWHY